MSLPPPLPRQGMMFVGGMDDGRVAGALATAGLSVLEPVDPSLFPEASLDVAVIDPATFGTESVEGVRQAAQRLGDTPFIILSGPCDRATLVGYIECPNTRAIVARDQTVSDQMLARAVTAITHGPRFGFDAHVNAGAPRMETFVTGSHDRELVLTRLMDFAGVQRVRRRLTSIAVDVTEELITNALYDAPTDAQGRRIYAEIDRRQAVFLAEGARPSMRAAVDGGELLVSVRDPFGSLDVHTVKRYLAKGLRAGPDQVDDKRGGAGLGFARIFALVDRITVHVLPGVRSEVTIALCLRGSRRDMASRPTGLVLSEGTAPG